MADDSDLPAGVSVPGARPKIQPTRTPAPRPPAKESSPRASTAAKSATPEDVTRAVATMNAIYGAIGAGLLFNPIVRLPQTADALADKLPDLEDANRQAFEASPQLAKLIAGAAPIASVSTFFVAHLTIAAGLIVVGREEFRQARAKKDEEQDGASTPDME